MGHGRLGKGDISGDRQAFLGIHASARISGGSPIDAGLHQMKLGVRLESLGLPFRPALAAASRLTVTGVQLDAVGDFHPDRLSETGKREIRHLMTSYGLELTA